MSDNKLKMLIIMCILTLVVWAIGALAFGPTIGRMACVIIGLYLVGWGVGNYMNSPGPMDKKTPTP